MTPPEASRDSATMAPQELPPAASLRPATLSKRSEFTRAARAHHVATPGFILQMRPRRVGEAEGTRVGFTCSKKVGNAVARNRAKRRLRELAWQVLPVIGRDGVDYVLIGRRGATADLPFAQLKADLISALNKLHGRLA